jgi:hypothetical protein
MALMVKTKHVGLVFSVISGMFGYGLNTAKNVRLANDLKPGYIKEPQSYPSKADSQLWRRMKVKIAMNCGNSTQQKF